MQTAPELDWHCQWDKEEGEKFSSQESCAPEELLTLCDNEVHVWAVFLDREARRLETHRRTLSEEEAARAARFYSKDHREGWMVARAMLRTILSRYLGEEPRGIRFCHNPWGKPSLGLESGGGALHFNLSHSNGIVLYALAWGREIGIDIEYSGANVALDDVAGALFSARQMASFAALDPGLQRKVFFACWTRKEAYVKARGMGLSIPLGQFDVPLVKELRPGEHAETENAPGLACWHIQDVPIGSGYVAAVAGETPAWRLRCRRWVG